jgi:enoyl-CoA hydratase/carnithine racemase
VSTIHQQLAGPARIIVLDRPHKRNALDKAMLDDLVKAITAEPGPDERVTVIRAEGPAFCAGLDLSIRHAEGAPEGASPVEAVLAAIDNSPLPVIAAVQGPAVAGGCELALAADLLVATETATFSMPLARLGTVPTWELASRLVTRLGPYLTQELLLTGAGVSAGRIAAAGAALAVRRQYFDETLERLVASVSAAAPRAIQAIRRMMDRFKEDGVSARHDEIDEAIAAVRHSADAIEGIAANRERRTPRFQPYSSEFRPTLITGG